MTRKPIIDAVATRRELSSVKELVIQEGYPRDKMSELWFLINKYYSSEFPNLVKLAQIGISAPVHTADYVQRWSVQTLEILKLKTMHHTRQIKLLKNSSMQ